MAAATFTGAAKPEAFGREGGASCVGIGELARIVRVSFL
jgi:hypothetical protein